MLVHPAAITAETFRDMLGRIVEFGASSTGAVGTDGRSDDQWLLGPSATHLQGDQAVR
jgi:hypothetical protein